MSRRGDLTDRTLNLVRLLDARILPGLDDAGRLRVARLQAVLILKTLRADRRRPRRRRAPESAPIAIPHPHPSPQPEAR